MRELLTETPSTVATFRQWAERSIHTLMELAEGDTHGPMNPELRTQAAELVRRAKLFAVRLGLYGLADKLPERELKTALDASLRLRECARYRIGRKSRAQLTPPQVAKRYGVNPDTVRGWIINGDLRATNIAKANSTRPQYRIAPEALAEFDLKRIASVIPPTPIARRRPKKSGLSFTRFSQ